MPSRERLATDALERLTVAGRAVRRAASLDEALDLAVETAADLLGSSRVALMLQEEGGPLRIRAARGIDPETAQGFTHPLDERLLPHLQAVFGPEAESRFVGVPLIVHGRVKGMLAALRPEGRPELRHERVLSALADQASVALEAARREETRSNLEQALRIVGHDVRSPLNALWGYVDLLRAEVYGPLTEEQRTVLDRFESVAGHVESVLDNALELSRLQADRLTVESGPIAVREAVDAALDLVELRARQSGVSIRVDVPSDLVARAEAGRLRQVLVQLLDNALRYSPPDGEIRIEAAARPSSERVAIRVADDGPGVEPAEAEAIFEPYRRLGGGGGGSGLGLAIARAVTELMAGELVLVEGDAPGATFEVRLPAP